MLNACFALLDDARSDAAHSRLYSDFYAQLQCSAKQAWPEFLAQVEQHVAQGLYAVAALSYDTGNALFDIAPYTDAPETPSRVLLFRRCELLTRTQVAEFLQQNHQQNIEHPQAGICNVRANVNQEQFTQAIQRIRDYIAAGDTYQVNYTYRLHFQTYGELTALYQVLRARQPVPYGALIVFPEGDALLSLSPELFVRHEQGQLLARPMKGTAPAHVDENENKKIATALSLDSKNRAENLMIVDLLRNDLGRVAVTGSVNVPVLFEVTRYSQVLQMTSTVQAQVRPELGLAHVLTALYPCGSITGAPKRRTMQIIREIESEARGVYTGAIGWFDPPLTGQTLGDFCLSVPIRTLQLSTENHQGLRQVRLGVGAGIVYDSVAHEEFAECQLKSRFLTGLQAPFELFETMRYQADVGIVRLDAHLARLQKSAWCLGFKCDLDTLKQQLENYLLNLDSAYTWRLRLALASDGTVALSSGVLHLITTPVNVIFASSTTASTNFLLAHKTSVRQVYDAAWQEAEQQGAFDAIFLNEQGFVTEGGRSNVFAKIKGQWFTPPLAAGVLPGVMRAQVLSDPSYSAQEKNLSLDELLNAEELLLCNSLRGILPAKILVR